MKHDFTKYLKPESCFVVKAKIKESAIKDQRMLALKVKDAIADQFNEKYGKRPSVDKEEPDVRFFIFGSRNEFRLSVDTTGHSLSSRGYRRHSVEAPLREHVAAGLIHMMNWDQKTPLVDPMCGSGTFLIEAALMLKSISPGSFHKKFSFQHFSHIPEQLFDQELEKLLGEETEDCSVQFYGYDKDPKAIAAAQKNAEDAGVEDIVTFERANALDLKPPVEKGILICNPPYGLRLGDEFFMEEFYKNWSYHMKINFAGWNLWMLSGDARWTRFLGMKAENRTPIDNGGVDCRWIHYKIKNR